jgi:MOSC domain-containing protein YiiM
MKKLGKIIGTYSATIESKGSMPRPKVETLNLIKDFGIQNDKFAKKDLDKTVMILGINSYEKAKENSINLEFGTLGENIVFDFDPHVLSIGTILKIADAEIQITQKCTMCDHLTIFHKQLPKIVKNCRGLYCRILKNGTIKNNFEVYIKE